LIERLKALPSVTAVGATTALPLSEVGGDFDRPYLREGETGSGGAAHKTAMRNGGDARLLRRRWNRSRTGRLLLRQMVLKTPPVIVVNETLARQVWPDYDAVGKRLVIWFNRGRFLTKS